MHKTIDVVAKTTDKMRLERGNLTLVEKREVRYVCQYTTMTDIGRELNRIEKFYQILLRAYPAFQRRIRRWRDKFPQKSDRRSNMEIIINEYQPDDSSGDRLEIGDMVKVLSYPQIKSTLNDEGCFKGLSFQEKMEKYCNNTYKVLKLPKYVLDQGGRKINKCKDVVILRGLYCNGKGTFEEEGCDRCCLHYWKTDWLKKVV
jgi:hypothetical protein